MQRFLQLHILTSYPPANLNRDSLGRPKTAKMGGTDRLRISSQSLKRTWRTSDVFQQALSGHIGTRTKLLGVNVYQDLCEYGVKEKQAKEWAKSIADVFGKLKKEDKENPLEDLEIEQLVHVSPEEYQAIEDLVQRLASENRGPEKEELELLRKGNQAADIAMFGRMLASAPDYNTDAACQVAHAISVHPVVIEDDYFTAVDDLNDGKEDMGAAHIGESAFAAALFYSYICINRELLVENLGGDEALAKNAITALTEAAIKESPKGKQNSFASRAYASYVLAETGDQQPRSLSVAFLPKLKEHEVQNYLPSSIQALRAQAKEFDACYGSCANGRIELCAVPASLFEQINSPTPVSKVDEKFTQGDMQALLSFVSE